MKAALKAYFEAASADSESTEKRSAVVSLFECKDETQFLSLIGELDSYLSSSDDNTRGSAAQLVALLLAKNLVSLSPSKVHHLFLFFTGRLEDYPSLLASLSGLGAMVESYSESIDPQYGDCFHFLKRIFDDVNVPSIAQSLRAEVFGLVTAVLQRPAPANSLTGHSNEVIEGVLVVTNGERDPRSLVKALHLLSLCLQVFPAAGEAFGEKVFDAAAGIERKLNIISSLPPADIMFMSDMPLCDGAQSADDAVRPLLLAVVVICSPVVVKPPKLQPPKFLRKRRHLLHPISSDKLSSCKVVRIL